jgi:hypothetical protein
LPEFKPISSSGRFFKPLDGLKTTTLFCC